MLTTGHRSLAAVVQASSSIGRAPVSKTGGWGFDSLLACQIHAVEIEQHVNNGIIEKTRGGVAGWWSSLRTFLTEVRNELKRVTWPSRKEVYATTFVVIVTSIFFGMYLFGLDLGFNTLIQWIFKRLGGA